MVIAGRAYRYLRLQYEMALDFDRMMWGYMERGETSPATLAHLATHVLQAVLGANDWRLVRNLWAAGDADSSELWRAAEEIVAESLGIAHL